jgi:hypothetical protein
VYVPLANFVAAPLFGSGCNIFVTMLDPSQPNSQDIVLGAMFWQSFNGVMRYNFAANTTNLFFQLN